MDLPRLQIASDLHLEFYKDGGRALLEDGLSWDQDADALVLAGDIGAAGGGLGALEMAFRFLAGRFPRMLYVPGNHEFYGCEAPAALEQLRALAAAIPSLTLLEPGVVADVGGRRVIGATLWFAETRQARVMERTLADFRAIGGFKPWVYEQHQAHVAWLYEAMREGDVVVTHHLPSPGSIAPRFVGDPMNCYFLCNLSSLILNRHPALWVHGHTHDSADYELYRTRIVANPHGYPHELNPRHQALVVGGPPKKSLSECLRPRSREEAQAELRAHMASHPPHPVVFLDFDGVLNTRPWTERPGYLERPLDPDLVARLGQLVAAAGAEVVLSSSWRSEGLDACRRHLQVAGFPSAERVVAVTAATSPWGGRAHEILDWVELHEVERFVVLDDDPGLTEVADHHVWTDPEVGLTAANVEAALAVLGRN